MSLPVASKESFLRLVVSPGGEWPAMSKSAIGDDDFLCQMTTNRWQLAGG